MLIAGMAVQVGEKNQTTSEPQVKSIVLSPRPAHRACRGYLELSHQLSIAGVKS